MTEPSNTEADRARSSSTVDVNTVHGALTLADWLRVIGDDLDVPPAYIRAALQTLATAYRIQP